MVGRGEITDNAWEQIALLLPDNGRRGGQWSEHRKVVNGILWRLRTGPPWRDLPSTVVLADLLRLLRALEEGWHLGSAACPRPDQGGRGGRGRVGGESVDDTVVRAHQHAQGRVTKMQRRGLATC
jgi:hypothetical protein